ncbi:cytochrome P450 1B1 [Pristis pectinata]|uniref:cytochrome P450 1B1 n=1 Tax=Pristis pectinata TaxID=685728 RepID=UPI00223DDB01|nr:cytochrome P450 1B1 [Pristis pectinata]
MISNWTCTLGRVLEKEVANGRELTKPGVQLVLALVLSALLGLQVWKWLQHQVREWNRPSLPGPFPWPVIGNAAQIGRLPHLAFCRMARRYGSLFRLKLGSRTVVVLNGEELIRQALIRQGGDFSGRPDFASFGVVSGGRSLAFGGHGPLWKSHRKVAHSTVRAFSTGSSDTRKAFEGHVVCEMHQLIQHFLNWSREGAFFDPRTSLVLAVANVISAVCFGKRYNHEDGEFQALLSKNDRFGKTVGAGSLVDVMPWLQYFPNPIRSVYNDFKQINREFYGFVQGKAREHRLTFRPQRTRDMLDAFIRTIEHQRGSGLNSDYVESSLTDIFGASQDTLSTALHWLILYLIWKPELQRKIQEEVDRVVGRERVPTVEDEPRLPYLMAFLHESMRFSSFVALTIPHSTTKDTLLHGYPIPKGTVVFVNQWSANHDPKKWPEPDLFDPSRFLNADGSINKDLTSRVMIFSLGRRRCIGEDLSKMQLFLSVALLTHQCTFRANPREKLTLDFTYGLTLKPETFTINVTLRDTMERLQAAVRSIEQAGDTQ